MNVSLTPELEKYVAAKVESGRYTSASEVVREALRLLEREEKSREEQIREFNRELQARIDSINRGEFVTAEESLRRIQQKSAERRRRIA